jgi:hypothetical protein
VTSSLHPALPWVSDAPGAGTGIPHSPHQSDPIQIVPRDAGPCRMVSAGATCCFRPTNAGSCRTVPARATQCHRVRSPHAAHRSCPIVTGRHIPTSADTRRYRTAHPGTAWHDPTLPVPARTIRDLLRAPAGRPRPPRQQAAPSGPRRHPATHIDTFRHSAASRYGAWRQGLVRCGEVTPIVSWIVTAVSGSTSPKRPRSSTSRCSALRRD